MNFAGPWPEYFCIMLADHGDHTTNRGLVSFCQVLKASVLAGQSPEALAAIERRLRSVWNRVSEWLETTPCRCLPLSGRQ